MSILTPTDVRPRLNKTSTVDDTEIQDMIDAAEAEFEELVGPLGAVSYTETHTGPVAVLRYPALAVESVTPAYGTALAPEQYTVNALAGIVTTGLPGTYTVVYTAGHATLPANYREAIIADVAGYFSRTQRGGSANRPSFPGDDFADAPADFGGGPVTMWPRIAALAARRGPVIA